jgi:hypothetical protein
LACAPQPRGEACTVGTHVQPESGSSARRGMTRGARVSATPGKRAQHGQRATGPGFWAAVTGMVYQTVSNRTGLTGNRPNRSGPVPVWSGLKPAKF